MNEFLQDVTLRNFRSYSEASFEFENGVNIIVGPNASGKTNLLEAVHCICLGKGLRVGDSSLIKNDETWLRVDAIRGDDKRSFIVEKNPNQQKSKKRNIINDKIHSRLKFDNLIPVVAFQPDDLRLTSGSPERRRNYIDKLLSQIIPSYKSDLSAYERVLKQRNTALKNNTINSSQLFAWDIQLVDIGSRIVRSRTSIIDKINNRVSSVYSEVAGSDNQLLLTYSSSIPLNNFNEGFLSLLEKNKSIDLNRGVTSAGPHRDDILIDINSNKLKEVGSRGENRTFVLALKFLEIEILHEVHKKAPIILLDDVFSELDGKRRKMLTKYLKDKQTIITTTDADMIIKDVPEYFCIAIGS